MRVIRVRYNENIFYASLTQDAVLCLNRELGLEDPIPLKDVLVLPPVMPTKIICAAVNYVDHGAELNHDIPEEPRIFLKPPSTIIGSGQPIVVPAASKRVDYEAELAVVMGKVCKNIETDEAAEHIFGYCCANDVTARDLQTKDKLFGRAKGFDTFCPVGPWIETEMDDPTNLAIVTKVNDEVVQQGNTSDMIFPTFDLVSFISKVMTLHPGDLILTGTPAGVGRLQPGDEVRIEIEKTGILINPVMGQES